MGKTSVSEMGVIGGFCKASAILVLVLAVLIGLCLHEDTNLLKKVGFFSYLDRFEGSRGSFFMGLFPAIHDGVRWGFTEADMNSLDLTGQSILITGGNVGLGYWSAYHLAKSNADVTIACRSKARCDEAADKLHAETGRNVSTGILDLSSFKSIRHFAERFIAERPVLHSLILNAGVMVPPFTLTEDGLESQIGINHFGHFLLTNLLLPALEATQGPSTVVAVSSAAHYDSYPEGVRWSIEEMNDEASYTRHLAYGQSKLANILFAQELAERVKSKGILVNSIHPGGVDTDLTRHMLDAVRPIAGAAFADWMTRTTRRFVWHPKDAALTQVYAAVSDKIRKGGVTGKYFHPIARLNEKPDPHTFNKTLQHRLWELSVDITQTK